MRTLTRCTLAALLLAATACESDEARESTLGLDPCEVFGISFQYGLVEEQEGCAHAIYFTDRVSGDWTETKRLFREAQRSACVTGHAVGADVFWSDQRTLGVWETGWQRCPAPVCPTPAEISAADAESCWRMDTTVGPWCEDEPAPQWRPTKVCATHVLVEPDERKGEVCNRGVYYFCEP